MILLSLLSIYRYFCNDYYFHIFIEEYYCISMNIYDGLRSAYARYTRKRMEEEEETMWKEATGFYPKERKPLLTPPDYLGYLNLFYYLHFILLPTIFIRKILEHFQVL